MDENNDVENSILMNGIGIVKEKDLTYTQEIIQKAREQSHISKTDIVLLVLLWIMTIYTSVAEKLSTEDSEFVTEKTKFAMGLTIPIATGMISLVKTVQVAIEIRKQANKTKENDKLDSVMKMMDNLKKQMEQINERAINVTTDQLSSTTNNLDEQTNIPKTVINEHKHSHSRVNSAQNLPTQLNANSIYININDNANEKKKNTENGVNSFVKRIKDNFISNNSNVNPAMCRNSRKRSSSSEKSNKNERNSKLKTVQSMQDLDLLTRSSLSLTGRRVRSCNLLELDDIMMISPDGEDIIRTSTKTDTDINENEINNKQHKCKSIVAEINDFNGNSEEDSDDDGNIVLVSVNRD